MGRRASITFGVAAVAIAVSVAPALAATPQQIYKDAADNGRLDGKYSKSDLQRTVHSTQVQGYGSPVVVIKIKTAPPKGDKQPAGGVEGGRKSAGGGGTVPIPPRGSSLPFTGAELGLFTVVGLALIGSGVLLRLTGRKGSN